MNRIEKILGAKILGAKILGAIAGTTLGLLATAGSASAFTIGGTLDGAEFDALGVDIPWAAETRIGRVGDHEINIHDSSNSAENRVLANYDDWVSGEAVDFSLAFDATERSLTYTVAGIEVSKDILESHFSDLYIRTSARVEDSSIVVDDLYLEDGAMSSSIVSTSSASCAGGAGCGYYDAEYLHISDIVDSFTLTGRSTMSWAEGSKPKNSQLAYQIKLVEAFGDEEIVDVPEPATMSLLSLGLLGVLAAGKRRRDEES